MCFGPLFWQAVNTCLSGRGPLHGSVSQVLHRWQTVTVVILLGMTALRHWRVSVFSPFCFIVQYLSFLAHKKRQVGNSDIWKICILCTKIVYLLCYTTSSFLSGRFLIQNKCASSSTIFLSWCLTLLLNCSCIAGMGAQIRPHSGTSEAPSLHTQPRSASGRPTFHCCHWTNVNPEQNWSELDSFISDSSRALQIVVVL